MCFLNVLKHRNWVMLDDRFDVFAGEWDGGHRECEWQGVIEPDEKLDGKSLCLMGKSTINYHFQ
jgi:hypothetical protein